jgi:hypothetical protein
MGRAIEDIAEIGKEGTTLEIVSLDHRIGSLLSEIEQEKVPDRLLGLAAALQHALILRRQRGKRN